MHHQREKYNQVSIIALLLAVIIGIFSIIKSFHLFILFSFYLLAVSIIAEALFLNISLRQIEGAKQLARGIMLIILVTYLFIKFVKGS